MRTIFALVVISFIMMTCHPQQYEILSYNEFDVVTDSNQLTRVKELSDLLIDRSINNQKNLEQVRGLQPEEELDTSVLNISNLLKTLYGNDKVGFILYGYENDILNTMFFDAEGIRASKEVRIKKEELLQLPGLVQSSLAIAQQVNNRSPRMRGAQVVVQNEQVDLATLSKRIFDILLIDQDIVLKYDHLIMSPVFNIASVPFYCLRFPGLNSYILDSLSYSIVPNLSVIRKSEARYSNSALEFFRSQSNTVKASANGLGSSFMVSFSFDNPLFVGNPVYPASGDYSFPDLPGAAEETKYAYEFIGKGTLLLNQEATKANITSTINNHDLIYIATHGISDPEFPLDNSYLVLTPDSAGDNYALTAREVQRMDIKADLVILSSCQSGLGLAHEGGTIGMARAFQIAGAEHVIMSLWNVNDYYTKELMKQFLYNISTNKNNYFPAEPLRQALLKIKQMQPDRPEYWGSFTVFGNPY